MRNWAMVLHFYQPPTQEDKITWNILTFCYLPLLRMLNQKSGYGLTVNISGCLLLQLQRLGAGEFFELTKKLIKEGKIEILGSAMDHPLLPITPPDVVERQIKENETVLCDLLEVKKPAGFFPPELAVSAKTIKLIKSKYVVVDERAVGVADPIVRYQDKYLLVNKRVIGEMFRSYQGELKAEMVARELNQELTVTANDAELFGHHYTERLQVLSELLDSREIKFITCSQALKKFGMRAPTTTKIASSTWQNGKGFELWTRNPLQQKYLKILALIHTMDYDPKLFDTASSSCYLYWLSNWPWWHPGLVAKGAANLIGSVNDAKSENAYRAFIASMWKYHNSGKVERNYAKFEEVRNLDKIDH